MFYDDCLLYGKYFCRRHTMFHDVPHHIYCSLKKDLMQADGTKHMGTCMLRHYLRVQVLSKSEV